MYCQCCGQPVEGPTFKKQFEAKVYERLQQYDNRPSYTGCTPDRYQAYLGLRRIIKLRSDEQIFDTYQMTHEQFDQAVFWLNEIFPDTSK